ncbi:MAG: DUF494 family protein [Gammaproteobacteria bacterium]
MKEDIFDVLMYLFENYLEEEIEDLPNADVIRTELFEAGFEENEVDKAFDWLESLGIQKTIKSSTSSAFRIFSSEEINRLDMDCRNFILFLETAEILKPTNRELVIDRIMALDDAEISLEKLKWIVLMVLLSRPGEEIAFAKMEDIVYEKAPAYLH